MRVDTFSLSFPSSSSVYQTEVMHWDNIDAFQERAAHSEVKRVLLDSEASQIVVAHGMGGTGKTICGVAVVKAKEIRQYFAKLTWVSVGQEASIDELQEIQWRQLTDQPMPAGEETYAYNSRLKLLQEQAIATEKKHGRILLVLDDPWIDDQIRFLNPLDPESSSKILITTRMAGLVKNAHKVPLGLFNIDEAAKMLLEVGQIRESEYRAQKPESEWPPRAALRISSECGLLPLAITLVGKIVRSWGAGWDEDSGVLAHLQKGNKQVLRRRSSSMGLYRNTVGSNTGNSLEQRIVSSSLESIHGSEAKYIHSLFHCLAVTVEDLMHDRAVLQLLWKSCADQALVESVPEEDRALRVRSWVEELVSRSLLLGNAAGIHLHDIVLGYLRSRLPSKEFQDMQRRAVRGLLMWAEADGVKTTGDTMTWQQGEEMDWYINRALSAHMKASLNAEDEELDPGTMSERPRESQESSIGGSSDDDDESDLGTMDERPFDSEAQSWCVHPEVVVRTGAIHAIGIGDFEALAKRIGQDSGSGSGGRSSGGGSGTGGSNVREDRFFKAALMLYTLASDDMIMKGSTEVKKRLLDEALRMMSEGRRVRGDSDLPNSREWVCLEFDVNYMSLLVSDADELKHVTLRLEELAEKPNIDSLRLNQALTPKSFRCIGLHKGNPSPTVADLHKGWQVFVQLGRGYIDLASTKNAAHGAGVESATHEVEIAKGYLYKVCSSESLVQTNAISAHFGPLCRQHNCFVPGYNWPEEQVLVSDSSGEGGSEMFAALNVLTFERHLAAWKHFTGISIFAAVVQVLISPLPLSLLSRFVPFPSSWDGYVHLAQFVLSLLRVLGRPARRVSHRREAAGQHVVSTYSVLQYPFA